MIDSRDLWVKLSAAQRRQSLAILVLPDGQSVNVILTDVSLHRREIVGDSLSLTAEVVQ